MIEIGRICVKTAGRDANLKCTIIDILDNNYVLIDGETRRRKCNILHLEPLKQVIKIKKKASHDDVKKEFEKLGLKARETKPKPKTEKPKKKRKTPEQLRTQKEEKRRLRDMFRLKRKETVKEKAEEKKKEEKESLEEKAGLDKEPEKSDKKESKPSQKSKKNDRKIVDAEFKEERKK